MAARIVLGILAGGLLVGGQTQSDFERRHAAALKAIPQGLTATLRTRTGRTTFNLFEPIPLEIAFASSRPFTYSIELKEGWNVAAREYWFVVDRRQDVIGPGEPGTMGSAIVCCDNDRPYLTLKPTVIRYRLGNFLRFERAGRYRVYYTTRRVFWGPQQPASMGHDLSDFTTVTNILTLTVLPDDPEWDRRQLAILLGIIRDPARSGPEKYTASDALSLLDTPEGIEARIAESGNAERQNWKLPNGVSPLARDRSSLIPFTTRPDLMCAAFEARVAQPDFAVTPNFESEWIRMMIRRDHREQYLATETRRQDRLSTFELGPWRASAYREAIEKLEAALPAKVGSARDATAATLERLRGYLGNAPR